jgi:hypothetical protein
MPLVRFAKALNTPYETDIHFHPTVKWSRPVRQPGGFSCAGMITMADKELDKEKSHWALWYAVAGLLSAAYFAAYAISSDVQIPEAGYKWRNFRNGYVARLFIPAAWLEAKLTGQFICLYGPPPDPYSTFDGYGRRFPE